MPTIETLDARQGIDIGAAPSPTVDTSAQRAAAAQGAVLAGLGQEISRVAEHWQMREQQTEDFSAKIGLAKTQQQIAADDQEAAQSMPENGAGWLQARQQAAQAKLDGFVNGLSPRLQQEFRQRADLSLENLKTDYAGQELKQRGAWSVNEVKNLGEGAENAVFASPDQLEKQRAGMHDTIKSMPIPKLQKQQLAKAYDESLEIARIKGLAQTDPEAAKKALGVLHKSGKAADVDAAPSPSDDHPRTGGASRAQGALDRGASIKSYFQQNYGLSEVAAAAIGGHAIVENGGRSSGKPGDNGISFGTFQWNGGRLANLKAFAAKQGADWTDQKTQLDFAAWEGEHGDAGAQRAWRELKAAQTPEQAATAWMHFERPKGYSADNPTAGHAYGRRLQETKALLGQSGSGSLDAGGGGGGGGQNVLGAAPEGASNIPYDKRLSLLNEVEARIREIGVQKRVDIDIASDNAATAITNTGDYTGRMPSRQDWVDAYGAENGSRKADAFDAQIATARQVYAMQGQTRQQIEASVAAARPTSSGEDAAIQQQSYQAMQAAAEHTLKARAADPAAYVMGAMPSVRAAWSGAQPGTDAYTNALRATAEAQRSIGIAPKDMQLLPDDMAKSVVKTAKDETVLADQRLAALTSAVFATTDEAQQQAIFRQMVKEGVPEQYAGVMAAVKRGDVGAARHLFTAAATDPGKLPGKIETKPALIDAQIQSDIMAPGRIGDAIYGLTRPSADSAALATRDAPLIKKSVELYLREGLNLSDAVKRTSQDMWGDVKVYSGGWGVAANAVIPKGTDEFTLSKGLEKATESVFRPALEASARRAVGAIKDDPGSRTVAEGVVARALPAMLDASSFHTYAPGRIGMVNDSTGQYYLGQDGQPLTVSIDDLISLGKTSEATRAAAPRAAGALATPRRGVQ